MRDWKWNWTGPRDQVRMSMLRRWIQGIIDNGGERPQKRRKMKEPEREGLIWRRMP